MQFCLRIDEAEETWTLFVTRDFPWATEEKFEAAIADIGDVRKATRP